MRRSQAITSLVVSGTLVLSACGGGSGKSGSGSLTITIGNVSSTGPYVPVYVANDLGFFKKQGLTMKYSEAVTPVQDKALIGGSLDFGTISAIEELQANAAGGDMVMIASMSNVPASSLYVHKSIRSIQELKGKAVAVGSAGTASYVAAQLLFDRYQMTGQVKLTPLAGGGPVVLSALQRNLVAGAQFAPPNTAVAAKAGYVDLVDGPSLGVKWVQGGVVTTRRFIKAHPDAVKKVGAALAETWAFLANPTNKAKAIALIAKGTGTTPAAAATTYDYMIKIWSSQPTPTVDQAGMQTAIGYTEEAKNKNLKAADQFDNGYVSAGGQ